MNESMNGRMKAKEIELNPLFLDQRLPQKTYSYSLYYLHFFFEFLYYILH